MFLSHVLKSSVSRIIQRWWKSSGFAELNFTRDRVAEIYFSIACSMFEPDLATCRAVYTKSSICIVILDDLYDKHGSVEDIKLFTEAVKRWRFNIFILFASIRMNEI
jgi:hypothetical protein